MQTARLDLLAETDTGELIHFELQSFNDPRMPLRMAEYALMIYRQFGRFPRQFVLYVGEAELRMSPELVGPRFWFDYELIDIRQIDEDDFLRGPASAGNILAILGRLKKPKETVREVLSRIAQLPPDQQRLALQHLMILSGLRGLNQVVQEEAQHMPIEIDFLNNVILAPAFKQGMEQGLREGRLSIVERLLMNRFGPLPEWVGLYLKALSGEQLEMLSDRLLDAPSLESLFGQKQ